MHAKKIVSYQTVKLKIDKCSATNGSFCFCQVVSRDVMHQRKIMITEGELKIRLGNPDDILSIAGVFSDSVRNLCKIDYKPSTIEHWIASKPPESRLDFINNNALWVAEFDGKMAGYLISLPGEIMALFVSSTHSGLGIRSALVKIGIDIAQSSGRCDVKLQVTLTAVPFYKKLGFREVSRGYYTHGESDLKLPIVNMILS